MPKQRVTSKQLPILLRKASRLLCIPKLKVAARGLRSIPLERILRRDLAKVVAQDILRRALAERARVGDVAEVLLALGLEERVQALRLAGFELSWEGGGQGGERQGVGER